jgi:type IV secretory pathway VirB10-like protein
MQIPNPKSQAPNPKRGLDAASPRVWTRLGFGIWVLGFGIFAATAAGGCAKAQASAPAGPPLDVPAPPERVLAPVEEPVTASAPEPEAPPPAPVATTPRTPPRPPARRTEPERPETPAPAAAATPATPAPADPPRELRPNSPSGDAAAERDARDKLARAARDLSRVDYGKLNADARSQYDQSKRFAEQAQQALKDRNFVFASTLADKAATLAAGLAPR